MKNPFDMRDYFVFGGLILLGIGCWLIYQPSAFVVVGSLVFLIGMRRRSK
jgi:hypothetical protein